MKIDPIDYEDPYANLVGECYCHPLYACIYNGMAWIYNTIHETKDKQGHIL